MESSSRGGFDKVEATPIVTAVWLTFCIPLALSSRFLRRNWVDDNGKEE